MNCKIARFPRNVIGFMKIYLCISQLLGERGNHGWFGLVGEKGEASFSGKYCLFMSFTKNWNDCFNKILLQFKGVKGEMGEPGQTGPSGFYGRRGLRGPKGKEGDAGLGLSKYINKYKVQLFRFEFFRTHFIVHNAGFCIFDAFFNFLVWEINDIMIRRNLKYASKNASI